MKKISIILCLPLFLFTCKAKTQQATKTQKTAAKPAKGEIIYVEDPRSGKTLKVAVKEDKTNSKAKPFVPTDPEHAIDTTYTIDKSGRKVRVIKGN